MIGAAPMAGARRAALSPRSLIVAGTGLACAATSGCVLAIGPVHLRIETGGVRYDDFVIAPTQEYGRIHSSKMVRMDSLVVASEQDLVLPRFSVGPTFTTLLVSVHHPEFVYEWTGAGKSRGGEMELPRLEPQSWAGYLDEHGGVGLRRVEAHLDRMRLYYVPAFEAGEPRRRLRRYLPGLRELVERASWQPADSGGWTGEAEARADLQETLQAVAELMQ